MKAAKIIFLIIWLDLLSKRYVLHNQKSLSPPLKIVQNPGLPFGVNLPGSFDLVLVILLFVGFVVLYQKFIGLNTNVARVSLGLIAGGAVANILDRVVNGSVTDFVNLGFSTLNLADFAIIGGIVLIALQAIRIPKF